MNGVVEGVRKQLEARGEYVVRSNIPWFAVFQNTLKKRMKSAQEDGRGEPDFVIYRTRSDDPRDHYVVPLREVRDLLVEETLSESSAGGQRWNLVLGDGTLHVSHRPGKIDIARFRGAPLLVEDTTALWSSSDTAALDRRVDELLALPSLPRPTGPQTPSKSTMATRSTFERRADVKAWVLRQAAGGCELCLHPAPFLGAGGVPYLELHHVRRLAEDGPDTVENAVAVCPGCHRHLHHGVDRDEQRERLYRQVSRLIRFVADGA